MNKRFRYYIYAYIRHKDSAIAKAGTPYYIGKGTDRRAYRKHQYVPLPWKRCNIVIMESNLTEIGALALERFYIRWYGRKDLGTGILLNRTDGGDESTGFSPSEETRLQISKSLQGNIPWNKGKKIVVTENHKQQLIKLHESNKGSVSWSKGKVLGPRSIEIKQKISKSKKGKIRVTNGIINKMCKPMEIPEGFYPTKIKKE